MLTKLRNILLFILLTPSLIGRAGESLLDVREFTFSHIGVHDGIVNQRVYSLTKTSDGAVWWTTKRDVGRTNGATVSNYRLANRETYASFAGRVVKFASYTDKTLQDSLFVFDNIGRVYRFQKSQNKFVQRYDLRKYLGSNIVVESAMATGKAMFFAMREGLYWASREHQKPVCVLKGLYCNAIVPLKDAKGNMYCDKILVSTNKGMLMATVGANGSLTSKRFIYSGYTDSGYYDNETGMLWIGTFDSGVKKAKLKIENGKLHFDKPFDWAQEPLSNHAWTDIPGVPHNPVRSIVQYGNTMLFGVDGYGVYQCPRKWVMGDPQASVFMNANEGRQGVLHGNGVYSILVGMWNNIFVGTYSGGIDIARPVGSTTAIFQHTVNSTQCISNDHVNCVAQLDKDNLLMGTDNGLNIFDATKSIWKNVAPGVVVLDVLKQTNGKLLLATYGNGVCEVGADGKAHTIMSKAGGQLKDDHVYQLMYDHRGNLWIGALYGSLAVKMPTGFKYYNVDHVYSLVELHDGRIAVGTEWGLYLINPNTGVMKELKYSVPGESVVNKSIQDIYEDEKHNLWLATDGGGVYVYNMMDSTGSPTKKGKCFQITRNNGLPSNSVASIIMDSTGSPTGTNRIWFGTEKGLAFIYPKLVLSNVVPSFARLSTHGAQEGNPQKVIDVNYCNGVRTEYIRGAACNLAKGHILFGTIDGAIVVDPQHLQELNYTAPLTILRVECADVDSSGVYKFNEEVAEMLSKGKLKLSYAQRSFELYFESINMRNHFDIAYQYKMDNGGWSDPSEQEYIRFVNLEPGKHHLTIRCVSETGGAVLDEEQLTIIISSPWWNSWWMWIIYIAILFGAFYGAWLVYDLQARYNQLIKEHAALSDTSKFGESLTKGSDPIVSQSLEKEEDAPDELSEFVNKATKIVLDNLKDSDFTIDTLCREIGMSRTLFYLKVKSYTGKSPQDFVRMIRLERAAALLKQGRTVGEVATLTGFDNPKYFSVVFKKYFSVSPSQYKV